MHSTSNFSPISPPPAVAIIIVTFQNAGEIAACLRSLVAAAPQWQVQLFLIDNASTDATRQAITAASAELPPARFHIDVIANAANVGFTRAVNQGLERYFAQRKRGEAMPVMFLNPDTILPPHSLAALMEKLYAFTEAGVIAPQLIHPDGRIQASCRRFPTQWDLFCELSGLSRLFPNSPILNRWKMAAFDHQHSAAVEQPQGACLLAKPEVVQQVGWWDERFPIFFSDVDWCKRVWEKGWQIRFEPSVQIVHAQGISVRQVRAAAIWSSHLSFWRYLRKHENTRRQKILNWIFGPLLAAAACVRAFPYWFKNIFTANAH
ncbi:MAG: N-acetylglucosaminyl-diphospho-decaprenol L-rhamnosyltransferase [bacterium]|nr:N-acetylglucosaminyl-diphospho-decaprenol L-rhamnosyltransferase [bacterium]